MRIARTMTNIYFYKCYASVEPLVLDSERLAGELVGFKGLLIMDVDVASLEIVVFARYCFSKQLDVSVNLNYRDRITTCCEKQHLNRY